MKILAHNRRASYDYQLLERFEAGLVLRGSEVKALKGNRANIERAFVIDSQGELFLSNAHIHSYVCAVQFGHEPLRLRKLLLRRRQIHKIMGHILRKSMTVVPTKIYLNDRGLIKMEIALAVGAKKEDKRERLKEKEWERIQHRALKQTHKL